MRIGSTSPSVLPDPSNSQADAIGEPRIACAGLNHVLSRRVLARHCTPHVIPIYLDPAHSPLQPILRQDTYHFDCIATKPAILEALRQNVRSPTAPSTKTIHSTTFPPR